MTTLKFKKPTELRISDRAYELIVTALKHYSAALLAEGKSGVDAEREIDIRLERAEIKTLLEKLTGG